MEHAEEYGRTADAIQELVSALRRLRTTEAQEAVSLVRETSKTLMWSVLLCVLVAGILIGPIGLATMHNVLSRLRRVTHAMVQLAKNDTAISVPSRSDPDEVGEMARAVEVFKRNAIQLIAREVELKQLNRRVEIAMNNMTHGLCMFDAEHKLIVCNKTYAQMYDLPPTLAKPGTTLEAIDGYREVVGNSPLAAPEQLAAAWRGPRCRPPRSPRSSPTAESSRCRRGRCPTAAGWRCTKTSRSGAGPRPGSPISRATTC